MKFSCSRGTMSDVLSVLNDIVPARSASPVLQNIMMQGNADGTLTLSATDTEIGLKYTIAVDNMQDPESVILPARKMYGLIKDDWASVVWFSIKDYRAEISSENGKFRLMGQSAEDFPAIKSMPDESVEMCGVDVVDAIHKTIFSAAKGDTRYALNGVMLNIKGKNVSFVSSDTHRLSLVKKKSRTKGKDGGAIVITKGMATLAKLAASEETVKIHLSKNEMIAETSRATLTARFIEGQFPRYADVIPNDMDKSVTVDRELFIKTLRLSGQMTNEETRTITLATNSDSLSVCASGNESGDGSTEVPAEVEGEISCGYNYIYILDVLKAVSCDTVTIKFRDEATPVRIDVGDFTHIIMPVKGR